jgi:hypothetical protein
MKIKRKYIITIFFIIILILSSFKVSSQLPKRISEDIWADGFFEGTIYFQKSEGKIIGELNHGKSSSKGVFQSNISINNNNFKAKGWFKDNCIYGSFNKNGLLLPLLGLIEINENNFKIYLIIPKGFIKANYTSSYLPPIKGNYGIGVKEFYILDESRKEILTENNDDYRELVLKIWYPTEKDIEGENYDYMTELMFAWLMSRSPISLPGVSNDSYLDVKPHAKTNVAISSKEDSYPVILFSHGLNGTIEIYTSFIEELVSRGYIVISINHPYIAGVVQFPDGRSIYCKDFYTQNDSDYATNALHTIVEDAKFVLDFAEILNHTDNILKGYLNLDAVGMYGHSFGGASTSILCFEDQRIDCGLTLDGVFYQEQIPDGATKPFFMMTADGRFNSSGVRYIWDNQESNVFRLSIYGSSHYGYTDVGLLLSHMLPLIPQNLLGFGTINPKKMTEIVRLFIVEFFNVYIKGESINKIINLAKNFSSDIIFEYK